MPELADNQTADGGEFFIAESGAKQLVDKALLKAQFIANMNHHELGELVLRAADEYISKLASTGELTQGDVELMKSHPDIVRDLDGFREFLDLHIRRARRATGKEE